MFGRYVVIGGLTATSNPRPRPGVSPKSVPAISMCGLLTATGTTCSTRGMARRQMRRGADRADPKARRLLGVVRAKDTESDWCGGGLMPPQIRRPCHAVELI